MLSPVIEETKTAGLKRILDIKGYNATVRFFRDICEVARICPSKYGSLHIDLQALLPQRGSDVILARYASLPVPPVPPCARPLRRCRAFDANLYELAIKNVTPAFMERLPEIIMCLTVRPRALLRALTELLLSFLKPTPHVKHLAQRDLFSQLEGLKQEKDVTM